MRLKTLTTGAGPPALTASRPYVAMPPEMANIAVTARNESFLLMPGLLLRTICADSARECQPSTVEANQ